MSLWQWLQFRTAMKGQGLVEYALLLILVAVVLVVILTILGPGLSEVYQNIIDNL